MDTIIIICECGAPVIDGSICEACGVPTASWLEDNPDWLEDDCPLDGDHDSTMESIGWGYDEQYEHNDAWMDDDYNGMYEGEY